VAGPAAIGFDYAYDHPHGGGLASSVGAQKTKQLARFHSEVYMVYGGKLPNRLAGSSTSMAFT
jgi:ribosomal protein L2